MAAFSQIPFLWANHFNRDLKSKTIGETLKVLLVPLRVIRERETEIERLRKLAEEAEFGEKEALLDKAFTLESEIKMIPIVNVGRCNAIHQ